MKKMNEIIQEQEQMILKLKNKYDLLTKKLLQK